MRAPGSILLCIVLLALSAGSARADTYCVNAPGCDAAHDKGTDLQAALTAAQGKAGPDDVVVGAGVYASTGFTYASPDAVHIDGAGGRSFGRAGPTLVDSASGRSGDTLLQVLGSSHSTISGIDVVVPGGSGSGNTGIETTGMLDDVLVESDDQPSTDATGVRLRDGAVMATTDVRLGRHSSLGDGVAIAGASVSVADSRIDASQGIVTETGGTAGISALVQRVRVDFDTAGTLVRTGVVSIEDALFVNRAEIPGTRRGLWVNAQAGDAALLANHVTLVGTTEAGAIGLVLQAASAHHGELTFRNGIVAAYPDSLLRAATGAASADLTTDYSDYRGGTAGSSGGGSLMETNHVAADPGFTSGGDFHLRPDSLLVDAGDPAPLSKEESPSDLAGAPRILDGGGDCVARRDIGAFEFTPGPRAPVAVATAAPAQPVIDQPVTFDASESCDPDGDPLTYSWTFDDGRARDGVSAQQGFSRAGLHFATVTVTDSTGRSASATVPVRVSAPPVPAFAGVTIPNQTLKVSRKGAAAVKLRCPLGTVGACTGRLALSRAGDRNAGAVSFAIAHGATRRVSVKLSKRTRTALLNARRLNVTAAVSAHDANGTTRRTKGTIKLVAPR